MFLLRLAKGLLKGLVVGALLGWAVAAAGFANMTALVAYPVAAVTGLLMALVAGKAIWEKDARLEVGMKALAGALLLGPGLMWVVRRFGAFALPFDMALLPGVSGAADGVTLGTFAVTALALVAGLVGGFFDVDNSAESAPDSASKTERKRIASAPSRIAEGVAEEEEVEASTQQDRLRQDGMRR